MKTLALCILGFFAADLVISGGVFTASNVHNSISMSLGAAAYLANLKLFGELK